MRTHISSTANELIKKVLVLQNKSRARKKEGLFIVEGVREISMALDSGIQFKTILLCEEIANEEDLSVLQRLISTNLVEEEHEPEWVGLTRKVYEHIAHRKTTEGLLGIAFTPNRSLKDLHLSATPLLLVAEASEKPGNIGALLRTADAANLDAVIIANPRTDLYNPNVIRASMGCLFTQQVVSASSDEIISFLKENEIAILTAALIEKSKSYFRMDFTRPTAIVVGTESTGLSSQWLENSDDSIIIPMEGKIDSLNVSVSAAILIFEAKRQRSELH